MRTATHAAADIYRFLSRRWPRAARLAWRPVEGSWSLAAVGSRSEWRRAAQGETPPNQVFAGINDRRWLWLNTKGLRAEPVLRSILPGLPDQSTQTQYTGSADDRTLAEGWQAYRLFRDLYAAHAGPLTPSTTVLDYGCGWGQTYKVGGPFAPAQTRRSSADRRVGHLSDGFVDATLRGIVRQVVESRRQLLGHQPCSAEARPPSSRTDGTRTEKR